MKRIISLLLLVIIASSSCEKDDICDANTSTTPRLVIDFYNNTNPTVKKNVTNLKVIGDGMKDGIVFNANSTGESKYLTNGNTISIPLKTDSNLVKYQFILNSDNPNPALINTDEVTFNYTTNEVYMSRACGFKTIFTFESINPIVHASIPPTKEKWMKAIFIQKTNIDNENETHIKVFF